MLQVAAVLDARLCVLFQSTEEAIGEYAVLEKAAHREIKSRLSEALNPPNQPQQLKAPGSENWAVEALGEQCSLLSSSNSRNSKGRNYERI